MSAGNNYYFDITTRGLAYFLILWIIIYFEPIGIGPLKISQIWKGILLIYLFIYLLKKKMPAFALVGVLYSIKFLIYTYFPYGLLVAVKDSMEALIFPVLTGFFYVYFKNSRDGHKKLIKIAIFISLFLIYSTIPFLFGMNSLHPEFELDKYGINTAAVKGLFYHIASASKMFTVATILIINFYHRFSNNLFNKINWMVSVTLGTYFVYASWTRTGWLIFIVCLIVSLYFNTNLKKKLIAAIITLIIFIGLFWFYQNNQAFQWRVTGGSAYESNSEFSIEELASSRLPFIIVAIDNLEEDGLFPQIIGYGTQHGIDLFERKTGLAINSHNRTTELLESSGLIGLFLYIVFIYMLFKKVWKKSKYVDVNLNRASKVLMVLFFGFYFTSHGTPIWGEIIYSCIFSAVLVRANY